MGAGASVTIEDGTTVAQQLGGTEMDFPKHGVRLSFYQEFIEHCGGKSAFEGLTTTDVCEKFVKPATAELRCSYCDMMRLTNSPAVGMATVFISHAWAYRFLDVCEALMFHFKDNLDTIVWFDLFAVNQHTTTLKPFEWWTTTFQSAIKDFGETVMVFAPWQDPVPLRRAWCLWELYSTVKMECKFEVALNRVEQEKFFADICADTQGSINKMLATVDVEKSECWNPLDRERIFEVVKSSVGFPKLNSVVFERLREWAASVTAKEIENIGDDNPKLKLIMKATLGRLQMQQSEYYKAKDTFNEIFLPFKREFGEYNPQTIDLIYQVGILRLTMRDFESALALLEEVIEKRTELSGDANDPMILVVKHKLGLLYERKEKPDKARELYEETFALMGTIFGETDRRTLSLMSDLASFYDVQEEKDKAIELYNKCHELHKQVFGLNHQDTISVYYNLSCLYYDQEKYDLALPIMEECYQRRVIALGEGHISSLDIMHAIATLQDTIGNEDKAIEMFEKRIEIYRQFFGADSGTTLYELSEIVKWFLEKKNFAKAEVYSVDWWKRSYRIYGKTDKVTEKAWKYVVHCYKKQQKGHETDALLASMEPPPDAPTPDKVADATADQNAGDAQ